MDGERALTMHDWSARLHVQDLATAEECGVPPDFWLIADTHFGDPDIAGYSGWPEGTWLAREYGGPVQLSDLTRFPDAPSRAIARGAYERYRRAVLDAAVDDKGSRRWPPSR